MLHLILIHDNTRFILYFCTHYVPPKLFKFLHDADWLTDIKMLGARGSAG